MAHLFYTKRRRSEAKILSIQVVDETFINWFCYHISMSCHFILYLCAYWSRDFEFNHVIGQYFFTNACLIKNEGQFVFQ